MGRSEKEGSRGRITVEDFAVGLAAALLQCNISKIAFPENGRFDEAVAVSFPVFRFRAAQAGMRVCFRAYPASESGRLDTAYRVRSWWLSSGIATGSAPYPDALYFTLARASAPHLFSSVPGKPEWYREAARTFVSYFHGEISPIPFSSPVAFTRSA